MSVGSSRRVAASAGAVLGVALVATGCTPASNLAVSMSDGVLLIATCDGVDSSEVGAWVREPGDESRTIWVAEGAHAFAAGDVFLYGVAPSGMDDDIPAEPLPSRERIGVHAKGEPRSLSGAFDIEDLGDGKWHAADGSTPGGCL